MKFVCGPSTRLKNAPNDAVKVALYERSSSSGIATAGASIREMVLRRGLMPTVRAWDFLAIALSVIVADEAVNRAISPDGWTRDFQLQIHLRDPRPWNDLAPKLESALSFLTTDRWSLSFLPGGMAPEVPRRPWRPRVDGVTLLSGGLDSLVGIIDLAAADQDLLAVSHTVRGDADKQSAFAGISQRIQHLQLNHSASSLLGPREPSQRSRSLAFIAYAVLAASATYRRGDGSPLPVFMCENGFIALNPPLTDGRVGSLSTRTAHPFFLAGIQRILTDAGISVALRNPYLEKTKGEMLKECTNQSLIMDLAPESTSCGRFQRYNYTHCGRCIPCQIRRAAFLRWGVEDSTVYVFEDLGRRDEEHAAFDDVRSVAMARVTSAAEGPGRWLSSTLDLVDTDAAPALRDMIERGLTELGLLHDHWHVA